MNLLQSVGKMLKSSKFIARLHCNRWSDIADCLMFLRHFPVRLRYASEAYISCQKRLLNQEINNKQKAVKLFKQKFIEVKKY